MKNNFLFCIFLCTIIIISCSRHEKSDLDSTNIEYEKAHKFDSLNIYDSAYVHYDKALNIFEKSKNNFGRAKCLSNMAKILDTKGNYFKGIDFSLKAKNLYDTKDENQYYHISDNYNNLGNIHNNLKKYNEAIDYYNSAEKYATDEDSKIIFIANIAKIYKEEKKYVQAIKIYDSILPKVKNSNAFAYARILSNLANIKWLHNKNYDIEPLQLKALDIQKQNNDKMGQNASYSHLSDYFKNKDLEKALIYAKKMYEIAKDVQSTDDELEALQKIISFDPKNYQGNFNQYIKLRDSIQEARNTDNDKFATIVYGVQEAKIKNAENETQILFRNVGIGALICILIIGIFWYKRRKKRLQQEKELEVKNTQLKMSKRVHDVVANGIYQVMAKIENQEDFDRNKALDELEFVYEKSRDLSYEKAGEKKEFSQEISELIAGFNNTTVKTFTAGNDPSVWEKVSPAVKEEVYQMIRELMVNMKKHSQASHVAVKFEKTDGTVEIQYKDNGVGISGDLIYKNGLRNTASRIEAIGGTITFDTKIEKGLKVNLSFPSS
ncbi:ATP-binding protein [uncultured Chryseobacterium sp.]|uniref:tetratricopeptide repeat-containing sensor histidine kinase n=1 Tax=uncultured Chryseobacterium sp. TaxID=259322 RepID=UPI0025F84A23|nr:ATP-binding protein [uncultured Chryseobacterium sp.]